MSRRTRAAVLPQILAACAAIFLVLGASKAFVPAADTATLRGSKVAAATAASISLAPFAAQAELPPLEDLELNELNPDPVRSTNMSFLIFDENNAVTYGVVVLGAIIWAVLWVNLLRPAKDEDGEYKTYIGGGSLPPEGYTNPLDPRMDLMEGEEEVDTYAQAKALRKAERQKAKADKAGGGGSAVV
mmetsp:Transcript_13832/g.25391  ORF Transcript_13832/g.25391 Transcript_13832/m.25391 type:complete len:187 (+) Transcript_13832:81-641(+)